LIALDGHSGKKKLPALIEKFLIPIEKHPRNAHLSKSKMADELLWRDIVDYNFSGVMSRPRSLEVPCSVLKKRLMGWSDKLMELVACPMSEGEFVAEFQPAASKQDCHQEEEMDDMSGEETAADDQRKEEATKRSDNSADNRAAYQQYLEIQSNQRTNSLRHILHSFKQSPMDVTLLAETEVGKSASKALKVLKKLKKQINESDEREIEEILCGYPRFWKPEPHQQQRLVRSNKSDEPIMTPLELLQQILQDWKDMASENGVEMISTSASSPPTKKRKVESEKPTTIATCGKDKKLSLNQHQIDMTLLHNSPDWRSLCRSLRERESIMRKSHGEKVRSIRDNLKKDRAKVGKVTLKKAVGRVRGSVTGAAVGQSLTGPVSTLARRKDVRREAILSKSLGNKARQQQLISQHSSTSSGGGKLSRIRNESKVAASWSKSTLGSSASPAKSVFRASAVATSSFGASVARAGGNAGNGRPKKQQAQLHVKLKNGRHMTMPASSSASEAAKTVGVFSSLQKKKMKQQQGGSRNNIKGNRKR